MVSAIHLTCVSFLDIERRVLLLWNNFDCLEEFVQDVLAGDVLFVFLVAHCWKLLCEDWELLGRLDVLQRYLFLVFAGAWMHDCWLEVWYLLVFFVFRTLTIVCSADRTCLIGSFTSLDGYVVIGDVYNRWVHHSLWFHDFALLVQYFFLVTFFTRAIHHLQLRRFDFARLINLANSLGFILDKWLWERVCALRIHYKGCLPKGALRLLLEIGNFSKLLLVGFVFRKIFLWATLFLGRSLNSKNWCSLIDLLFLARARGFEWVRWCRQRFFRLDAGDL